MGERVLHSARLITPGATVAVDLHGPMSATLGGIYARSVVDPSGSFTVRLRIAAYPDGAAREWHTVVLAALSSALIGSTREGAAVTVQADPIPIIDLVPRAPLARSTL